MENVKSPAVYPIHLGWVQSIINLVIVRLSLAPLLCCQQQNFGTRALTLNVYLTYNGIKASQLCQGFPMIAS
jgi:hypothetical protein